MIDATHFVLDLETLSTAPNAAIVAIGCVRVEHGKVVDEFYERVDLESARAQGGQVDTATLQWWLTQPDEARREISGELPGVHITAALAGLRAFMLHGGLTEARPLVWGNGSSFDNVIVRSAFERAGIPEPWRFWNDRDLRTLLALRGLTKRSVLFEGTEHHALHDARHEARLLIQALWPQQVEPAPAQIEQQPEQSMWLEMIDAAMIEMRNIAPPLRRSECERLIRAALAAQGAVA
ncbi:3'-5' exoribonuclease [Stutzerimonas nosocomialis]|uniref:3'-5' exoribonuclease n=1 Tax=Stutzerimonas nosocomialis TaxID=1056496 RepID=A0A5R9QIL6_9GAMM|nr:3'-5' exonuclease [Stutzerimonas nosocomialis]TLX65101.1 3'-5' exoribonuclease [Stutzerimonas nosocomialis]